MSSNSPKSAESAPLPPPPPNDIKKDIGLKTENDAVVDTANVSVVIVGAGVAGLTCARQLIDSGTVKQEDIVILEARDRIGGRTHTVRFGKGLLDRGGSWVHGVTGNVMLANKTVQQSKLKLAAVENSQRGMVFDPHGHDITSQFSVVEQFFVEMKVRLQNESQQLPLKTKNESKTDICFEDAIARILRDEPNHIPAVMKKAGIEDRETFDQCWALLLSGYEGYMACMLKDLSTHWLYDDIEETEQGGDGYVVNGYCTLVDTLARNLPIHTSHIVSSVTTFAHHASSGAGAGVVVGGGGNGSSSSSPSPSSSPSSEDEKRETDDDSKEEKKKNSHKTTNGLSSSSVTASSTSSTSAQSAVKKEKGKGKDVDKEKETTTASTAGGSHPYVRVETTNGRVFNAKFVVITIPVGVLRAGEGERGHIRFSPSLPPWKMNAIQNMGFGILDKVALRFRHCFWEPSHHWIGFASTLRRVFPWFYDCYRHYGDPILVAFVSNDFAAQLETYTDERVFEMALDVLGVHYGKEKVKAEFVEGHVTRWGQDEFARGSYSSVVIPGKFSDYDLLAAAVNGGRVRFAGEATNRPWPCTVHGAHHSGIREATAIARILHKQSKQSKQSVANEKLEMDKADQIWSKLSPCPVQRVRKSARVKEHDERMYR